MAWCIENISALWDTDEPLTIQATGGPSGNAASSLQLAAGWNLLALVNLLDDKDRLQGYDWFITNDCLCVDGRDGQDPTLIPGIKYQNGGDSAVASFQEVEKIQEKTLEDFATLEDCMNFLFLGTLPEGCTVKDFIELCATLVTSDQLTEAQVTALAKACFDEFPAEEAPVPETLTVTGPVAGVNVVRRKTRVERDRTGYIIAFSTSFRVDWTGTTANGWVTIVAPIIPGYEQPWLEGSTYAVAGDQRPIDGTADNNRLDMPDVPWNDANRLYFEHFNGKAEEVTRRTTLIVRWVKS